MKYLPRSARLAWRCVCGARLGEFIRVSCTTIAHRDTAGRTLAPSLWSALAARPHHLRLSSRSLSQCQMQAGAILLSGHDAADAASHRRAGARGEPLVLVEGVGETIGATSMPTTTTVTTTVTVTTASGEVSWPRPMPRCLSVLLRAFLGGRRASPATAPLVAPPFSHLVYCHRPRPPRQPRPRLLRMLARLRWKRVCRRPLTSSRLI
jgi:hypothetical protein